MCVYMWSFVYMMMLTSWTSIANNIQHTASNLKPNPSAARSPVNVLRYKFINSSRVVVVEKPYISIIYNKTHHIDVDFVTKEYTTQPTPYFGCVGAAAAAAPARTYTCFWIGFSSYNISHCWVISICLCARDMCEQISTTTRTHVYMYI